MFIIYNQGFQMYFYFFDGNICILDLDGGSEKMDVSGEHLYWWRYQNTASRGSQSI